MLVSSSYKSFTNPQESKPPAVGSFSHLIQIKRKVLHGGRAHKTHVRHLGVQGHAVPHCKAPRHPCEESQDATDSPPVP